MDFTDNTLNQTAAGKFSQQGNAFIYCEVKYIYYTRTFKKIIIHMPDINLHKSSFKKVDKYLERYPL